MTISMAMSGLLLAVFALGLFVVSQICRKTRANAVSCRKAAPTWEIAPGSIPWLALPPLLMMAWLVWVVMRDFLEDRASRWVMSDPTFEWIAPGVTVSLVAAGLFWLLLRNPSLRLSRSSLSGCSIREGGQTGR